MRRPTSTRRALAVLAALSLAGTVAACGDDGGGGGAGGAGGGGGGGLSGLISTTTTEDDAASTTTTVEAVTTTTVAPALRTPSQVAATLLTDADVPGYGGYLVTDSSVYEPWVTDPVECGEAMNAVDYDQQIALSGYWSHPDAYSTVTQAVSTVGPDAAGLLDEMRTALDGPCADPFFTESLGWASGTLRFERLADPEVGEDAVARAMHMDIVQEGTHVAGVTYVVTVRRANVVFTVHVLTGDAVDGSFTGPAASIDDAIAYAAIIDQRIVEQLDA